MASALDRPVTIVVVNHNGASTLRACVEAIGRRALDDAVELSIVDTGSVDGSLEYARGVPGVTLFESTDRHVAKALNRAFAAASGNDVLRIDSDVVVEQDGFVARLARVFQDDPQVGVVGAKLVYPDDRVASVGRNIVTGLGIAERHANLCCFCDEASVRGAPREVDSVPGAFAYYRREVLDRTGGVDEGYWPRFLEDDDLCMMARHAGFKVFACPDVRAVHHAATWSPTTKIHVADPDDLIEKAIRMKRVVTDAQASYWQAKWGWDPRFPDLAEIRRRYGETRICWRIGERMRYRPSSARPPVDVCMVTWNNLETLRRCMGTLAATRYPEVRVHVTDNGSTDGTVDYLEELRRTFPFPLRVHGLPVNTGVAVGFNWAIAHGDAALVARIDDDVLLPPEWLERLVEGFHRRPFAGVVGPKILNDDAARSIQCAAFRMFPGIHAHEGEIDVGQADYVARTAHVRGCCNLYRRDVLDECGLFDVRFSPTQWDDPDHHVALGAAGYEILYDGRVGVVHAMNTGKGRTHAAVTNQDANRDKFFGKWGEEVWMILDRALDLSREGRALPASDAGDAHRTGLDAQGRRPRAHVPEIAPAERQDRSRALRYRELALSPDGPLGDYWQDLLQHGLSVRQTRSAMHAAQVLSSLVDLMPHWPNALAELGENYRLQGQTERAERLCERAARLDPAVGRLGSAARRAGRAGEPAADPADRGAELGEQAPAERPTVLRPSRRKELRVLMVNSYQTRVAGGDMLQVRKTAEHLRDLGVEVDVSYRPHPDPTGYDLCHVFNLWFPNQTLPQVKGLRLCAPRTPIVLTPIYWDMAEKNWADIAVPQVFRSARSDAEIDALLAELAAGTLTVDGVPRTQCREPGFPGYRDYQRAVLQLCDHLLPQSEIELGRLRAELGATKPATVVPNGVEHNLFAHATPDWFVREYGARDFVLTVGLVEPRKNQLLLLRALRGTGLRTVVVGRNYDPEYLRLCRKHAAPDTVFIEHLPHEQLASAMRAARVFCLPSWMECAAFVNIEAAAAGCALALSDKTSEQEYFGDGAYYCDPADVSSIRAAVLAAHRNHEQDGDRRARLQELCATQYTWPRVAERTLAAYRSVLQGAGRLAEPTPAGVR